ncbi:MULTISPECIES: hypothetical protein [Salegentibacter]|jgi:hypothetical protein|uniref:Uncharacterized protein n=1 Tax=Salegentibacter agarivorans TaxID=345907 RepID=A0A1I2M0Q9_9FLAO|nr:MULTISPECIES: hypothetical protein [Salegentibacter]APS38263.1 hypothetical protein AO058_04900 [Salegentibacter sp. T436]SFF84428.1 hypothetical protein SAMN04488033_11123 [Salegentibacter agarivorans]|tara:strand:+ start:559 stop:828 length:270 start_codon:yes stop_codon:yes gene_type:complete
MDTNALKIELIQKIIACNDIALLKQVEELLQRVNALEPGEEYELTTTNSVVPDRIYEQLEKDFIAYQNEEIQSEKWEKVEHELKEKYGL